MKNKKFTRRDFIKSSSCAAIGMAVSMPSMAEEILSTGEKSKVVLIRNKDVIDDTGKIDEKILQAMLDEAMMTLFPADNPASSWKQIISSDDIVGVKSNEWGPLPTPPELESAIKKRIIDVGVDSNNISIADRNVLGDPVFLKSTALINVRPMRTHAWSGVGSLLKNYIMFTPSPPDYHDNSCANLGALWELPLVKNKTRLNILVLLTPLFYGVGPHHFDKTYLWSYKGLLVGVDPVALDSIGVHLFQEKRKQFFGRHKPIKPSAHHVALADKKFNLGNSDLKKIELIKLGWQEDILI